MSHYLLHPAHIPVTSELTTDFAEGADCPKSETLVKGIRRGVRLRNSRNHAVNVLALHDSKKLSVQPSADSLSGKIGSTRDAHFNGRLIGFFGTKAPSRHETYNAFTLVLGHQQTIPAAATVLMKPGNSLLRGKWQNVEIDVRVLDIVVLNLDDSRQVRRVRGSHGKGIFGDH